MASLGPIAVTRARRQIRRVNAKNTPSLFLPLKEGCDLHPSFRTVFEHEAYAGTRLLLDQTYAAFPGANKNFRNSFRGAGFSAALFELFIFNCLDEAGYAISQVGRRPDFAAVRTDEKIFIEVTTSNPPNRATHQGPTVRHLLPAPVGTATGDGEGPTPAEILEHMKRVANPLRAKLGKGYDKLEWVGNTPVVLAIAPFHDDKSLTFSAAYVLHYLYGDVLPDVSLGEIPPFFSLPESKSVSAVLFSNSGTVAKFHRIAVERDLLPTPGKKLLRSGWKWLIKPDVLTKESFRYTVTPNPVRPELWSDDVIIAHNPATTNELNFILKDALELKRIDGHLVPGRIPSFCAAVSAMQTDVVRD